MENVIANIVTDFNDGTLTLFDLPYSKMLVELKRERSLLINKRLKYLTKMKVWARNTNYEYAIKKIVGKHRNDANYKKLNSSLNTIFKERFITGKKFYSNVVFLGYIDTGERQYDLNTNSGYSEEILFDNYFPNNRLHLDEKGKLDLVNRIIGMKNNADFYKCICAKGGLRYLNLFEVLGKIYILGTSCAVEFPLLLQKEMEKQGIILDCIETLRNDMIDTYNEVNFEDDKTTLLGIQKDIDNKNEEIREYYKQRKNEMLEMKKQVQSGKINLNNIKYNIEDHKYIKQVQEDTTFEREKYCLDNKKYIDYRTLSERGQQYLDKIKGTVRLTKLQYRLKMQREREEELEVDCEVCRDTGRAYMSDGCEGWCMECSVGDERYAKMLENETKMLKKEQKDNYKTVMDELKTSKRWVKHTLDTRAEWLLLSRTERITKIGKYRYKRKKDRIDKQKKLEQDRQIKKNKDRNFNRERAIIYGEKINKRSSTARIQRGTPIDRFFKKVKI